VIVIRCPHCGEQRTEEELVNGGEADVIRPTEPAAVSDTEWTDYLFMRRNPKAIVHERWCCAAGCGQWFKVARHAVTHEVSAVLRLDQPFEA
jgi:sarcosine oxidase subunit delta